MISTVKRPSDGPYLVFMCSTVRVSRRLMARRRARWPSTNASNGKVPAEGVHNHQIRLVLSQHLLDPRCHGWVAQIDAPGRQKMHSERGAVFGLLLRSEQLLQAVLQEGKGILLVDDQHLSLLGGEMM